MNIDILEDLIINVSINETNTKTINNIYSSGSPAGTYLPGKDFSPTDNISAGVITSYKVGIALSSKTNQTYPIDKFYLQSADDPQTNGTGKIPFYLLNNDPNPENITDNGLYTLFPGYEANMTSVVFGPDAGITSTSTITLTLNVNYPLGIYWKTKIAPKIYAVAVKNNISKKSSLVLPTEVKMSSIANIESNLFHNNYNDVIYTTQNNQKGLLVPFYISENLTNPNNLAILLDDPIYTTITYNINLDFTIDGTLIPLTNDLITATSSQNIIIESINVTGNNLIIIVKRNGQANLPIDLSIRAFLPYDAGTKSSITLITNVDWNGGGSVWNNFENQYIFNKSVIGGFSYTRVIPLTFIIPPRLTNTISASLQATFNDIYSYLQYSNLNFIRTLNSKLLLFYDSSVSWITDALPKVTINYTDILTNTATTFLPNSNTYIQQYGYVSLPSGYDPNTVSNNIMNGLITLGTYSDILASGHKPNVLITTFLEEVLTNLNINYANPVTIFYQDAFVDSITNTQFLALYNSNPSKDYTSYLYTSMRMNTNFTSVSQANSTYGNLLGIGDSFVNINNQTYLFLATKPIGTSIALLRFNGASEVRFDVKIPVFTSNFQTSITNDNLNTLSQVFDYTQTYPLRFYNSLDPLYPTIAGNFIKGSIINFTVPNNIIPYLYLAGDPGIYKLVGNQGVPILVATITEYQLSSGKISITLPQDITFDSNKTIYIEVPIKFLMPASDKIFNHQTTYFDKDKLLMAYQNQITTDFPASTSYYNINQKYVSSTLIGGGVDFTGLTVNKNFYPNDTSVIYIASVKNLSNNPSSIYVSMTVPTNKYNPLETSNNSQEAYINNITKFKASSTIYYQTKTNATQADIIAMKQINIPGTNLEIYYNTVIVNTWSLFVEGNILPNDVVMMVAKTDNVSAGEIIRIDYKVKVEMDINTTNTYINDAAINYYSSSSMLETQSNKVTIRNYNPTTAITILKEPSSQNLVAKTGEEASFVIKFNVPEAAFDYTSLIFTDSLAKSLTLLSTSTLQINNDTPVLLNAQVDANNTISKPFSNPSILAGNTITINLHVKLTDLSQIPSQAKDYNQANVMVNNDPSKIYNSNIVEVNYIFEDIFNPKKSPINQDKEKTINSPISFSLTFDVPLDVSTFNSLVLTDKLDQSLTYDSNNSYLQIGTTPKGLLDASVNNNIVEVNLSSFISEAAGQTIKITLGTLLTNPNLIPSDDKIINQFKITLNNILAYSFLSNLSTVTFGSIIIPIPITKLPNSQLVAKKLNSDIIFNLSFKLPNNMEAYTTILFEDVIAACLTYSNNSTFKIGNNPEELLNASVVNNIVSKSFTNLSAYEGQVVTISLKTTITSLELIPSNNKISNQGKLMVNNDPLLISLSNIVFVYFDNGCNRCQAINDIIESIALEQTALSHILNAEGEKIQKALEISTDQVELIKINTSVERTVNLISILELVLQEKINLVKR